MNITPSRSRWFGGLVVGLIVVGGMLGLIRASAPRVPSHTWAAAGDMAAARAGASATLLTGGRVLIAGGRGDSGVTVSAERYSPASGGFIAAAPMQDARANHSATLLRDGRVLVAGGTGPDDRALSSAELYDPAANVWSPVGPLTYARSGHTATLLPDGRVLVAGGDDSGVALSTLEVFDPAVGIFSPLASTLSVTRSRHAAALTGSKVLIAGGSDGSQALASVDLFDPVTDTISAGPSLQSARAGHTATTLLDGKVLVAGGASDTLELASAELFDPASGTFSPAGGSLAFARQHHAAVLLPHNNAVLFIGGSASGSAVAAAELYVPWQGTAGDFVATGVPAAARSWAAAGALSFAASDVIRSGPADGLLLLAGGTTASVTTPLQSAELYGFATIKTDKEDYSPGSVVTITGGGWQPGEWVTLLLKEWPAFDEHPLLAVQADGNGNIVSTEFVPDQHDIGIKFYLTAFGAYSQAQTTFWDNKSLTITFAGNGSGSVAVTDTTAPGSSTTCSSNCAPSLGNNDVGTLTATPSLGSVFAGWSGQTAGVTGCAGATCSISMGNSAQSVTATFNLAATKLVFTTLAQTLTAGVNSGVITVQRQNASNSPQTAGPLTVNLSTTSATGTFRDAGDTTTITTITIPNGSSTADFKYKDTTAGSPTITAAFSGLTSATQAETVNAAAASKVAFSAQPTNTVAGQSITPAVAAQIQDQFGNLTNSTANVTVTIGTNPASGTLSGAASAAAVAGVATFSNLSIDKAGTGYTLAAASTGLTSAASNAFNITAAAASKLAFSVQPSTTGAGASITPAVKVQVQDQFGNLTTSTANVTIAIGNNPGGGSLSGTTTVAAVAGVATFSNLSIHKVGTGYTLAASSGALTGTTSSAFDITPGAASKVVFGVQPSTTVAGTAISPAVTVQVQDAGGNLVTGSTAAIALAMGANPGTGTLSGGAAVAAVNGVATFSALSINKAGNGYTLAASSTGLAGATSTAFNIVAGSVSAAQSTVSASPTSLVADGSATSTITVTVKDANGNPVSGKAVSLSQGTGSSTISAASGPSSTSGVVTFTVKDTKAETVTYTATDTTDSIGITQTAAVTFTAGALDHFAFATISSPQTAGTPFAITITAQDVNNNTVTSFDGNGFKAVLTSTGTLVGAPITTPSFTAGVLSSQSVTITNTGSFTITANGNGNDSGVTGTSNSFTVNPGSPNKLAFGQQPTTTSVSQTITPGVTVQILDANGNRTSSSASVALAISPNPTSAVLGGTLAQTAVNGVASFGNLSVNKGGTYTLAASSSGLTGASSASFTINNPAPTLTSIAPVSGNLTQTLSVVFTGTNFVTGVSTVSLGSNIAVNTLSVDSGTQITANVTIAANAAVGPRNVSVTNSAPGGGTATLTNAFTVNNPATTTVVSSSSAANTSTFGDSVTFTATVASQAGTPTGSVTFYDGGTCAVPGPALSAATALNASGIASAATTTLSAGTHTVLGCYVPTGIFNASNGTVSQVVNKGTPTVTWSTPADITYGTALGASQLNATTSVPGSLTYLPAAGTVLNAGNQQTLSVSFTPTDAANYNDVPATTVKINVLKATATITVTPYTVVYDGNAHTATGTATGVGGADLSAGLTLTGTTHTHAATYAADPWSFAGGLNYNDANGTVDDLINRANATITVTGYTGVYDAAPHGATGSATGVEAETLAGLSLGASFTNAPGGTATWTFADATGNYNNATGTAAIVINKADAAIHVMAYAVAYTGAAHTATGTATGVANVDLSAGLTLTGTTHTHAGTYAGDPWSFAGGVNYNDASGTVDDAISKANATITVTGYTGVYDAAPHGATGSATGVQGEALAGLSLGASFTNVPGGTATWTFTDATGNYNNATGTVAIVISKADASIHVTPYAVAYDATAHTAIGTATGVGGADLSAGLTLTGTTHTHAGTYAGDPWSFAGGINYNDASGTVDDAISQVNATVVVNGYTGVYDGNPHGATGSAKGVLGEPLSGLNLGASFTNVPGGTATWTFTDVTGNYNNATGTAAIVISKADPTITVNGYSGAYDGASHGAGGSAKGVKNEALTGLSLGATFSNVPGGTATWTFTDVTGNYSNASGTAAIVITKANATILVNGYSGIYDAAAHAATGSAKGVLNEPLAGLDLGAAFTNVPGGTANWKFTDVTGNYNNASGTAAIVIAKATPTVNVTGGTFTYDAAAHGASGTVTGVGGVSLGTPSFSYTPGGSATPVNPGTYVVVGTYVGSANYATATGTATIQISYGTCSPAVGSGGVILQPINSDGTSVYNRKGGSTIPVKFRVCDAAGRPISTAAAVFAGTGGSLTMLSSVRGTVTDATEGVVTDVPDAAYRWDASGQQWIFNMATTNLTAGNTYGFRINLALGNIQFQVGVK
jgi:hypothetical protein